MSHIIHFIHNYSAITPYNYKKCHTISLKHETKCLIILIEWSRLRIS